VPTKDASKDSFPGDHGMMLLIFAAIMLRYFGQKAFAVALIIFVVFAFPRVMIGAHWFTDIAVGSLSVALIALPWCLMTPERLDNKAI
jgi:membrane-associated phospholipid phosphatase